MLRTEEGLIIDVWEQTAKCSVRSASKSIQRGAIAVQNTFIHGDCLQILPTIPAGSVNFILTDPPYITNYRGRDGRTVPDDDNEAWLKPAFAEMFRVLANNTFCVLADFASQILAGIRIETLPAIRVMLRLRRFSRPARLRWF